MSKFSELTQQRLKGISLKEEMVKKTLPNLPGLPGAGASYMFNPADPNKVVLTPRDYGGVAGQIGSERDHIIPVALGGTSDANNIKVQADKAAKAKDNVEKYYIDQYKKGKISLGEAKVKVLNWDNIDIPGQKSFNKNLHPTILGGLQSLGEDIKNVGKNLLGVIQKIIGKSENKSPVLNSQKEQPITTISAKSPQDLNLDLPVARENKTTSQMIPTKETPKTLEMMIGIPQSIARSGASVGLTLASPFSKITEMKLSEMRPGIEKTAYSVLYGGEPVKALQQRIAEQELQLPKGESLPLGIKAPSFLAAPIVGAMTALDFSAGGGEKSVAKDLLKSSTIEEAGNILRKIGVSEELIKNYAPKFAKSKDLNFIKKGLNKISDIQKTAKLTPESPISKGLLGIDKFIEQDIKPTISDFMQGLQKTTDFIKKVLTPSVRGKESQLTASILRENLGKMARQKEIAYSKLVDSRKVFDRFTPEQSLDFINKLETGQPIKGAESFVDIMRTALDSRWEKIQDIKGISAYIENYFPHIWEDPQKAADVLAKSYGKRPLAGTTSYLKQRVIPTIAEGVKLGLKPASYNPVDSIMARLVDMDRFLMANDVWKELGNENLRKFVRPGERPPIDWIQVNDKISKAFQFSEIEKGVVYRGSWYMPEQAATLVNNYLSPGLAKNPIYNSFRMIGNSLNQVQLGFSLFHAGFTTGDSVISKTALNLQKVFDKSAPIGERLTSLGKVIVSPITAPYTAFQNVIRGNKMLIDYFKENPEIPKMVDALERAGGRVKMDNFYLNNSVENFLKALRSGNIVGAAVRAPGALVELTAKPLMQEFVPRQKLGVFADLAKDILTQSEKNKWGERLTTLRLQEAWDSVDNRMGQLVYDNLFWNKVLKDLGMGSVRSVGWNLGTIRELGGGMAQYAKLPLQLLTKEGRAGIRMTPKMAYTISLPFVVGTWGAIAYYLYNGKAPEKLIDYYYPKTGKIKPDGTEERISLPSYMKDVFAYKIQPLQTLSNKAYPLTNTLIDMFQNKDYYGTEIRNVNDPMVKQISDEMTYLAKQYIPFSIQGAIQRKQTGGGLGAEVQSFFGLTPSPGYITKSSLELKIQNLYIKRMGKDVKTQEQGQISQQKAKARQLYLAGDIKGANDILNSLNLTPQAKSRFVSDSDIPSDIRQFRQLPASDQEALLKTMELYQLNRYAWYANQQVKSHFSSLSDNAKNFVDMFKQGQIKEPVWKKEKQVNQ